MDDHKTLQRCCTTKNDHFKSNVLKQMFVYKQTDLDGFAYHANLRKDIHVVLKVLITIWGEQLDDVVLGVGIILVLGESAQDKALLRYFLKVKGYMDILHMDILAWNDDVSFTVIERTLLTFFLATVKGAQKDT